MLALAERLTESDYDPDFEARLRAGARRFEVGALLMLLRQRGYPRGQVLLKSHWSRASAATLIHRVDFRDRADPDATRRVAVVWLNMGLLSAQTPLPDHLLGLFEDPRVDEGRFADFVHYFDHVVLERYLMALHPELDPVLSEAPAAMSRSLLSLVGLDSRCALHWAAQRVFPELAVLLRRGARQRTVAVAELVLGEGALSESTLLGGTVEVPGPGYLLALTAEDAESPTGQPWPSVVDARLQRQLFPLMAASRIALQVTLTAPRVSGGLGLGQGRLGLQPMADGDDEDLTTVTWFSDR